MCGKCNSSKMHRGKEHAYENIGLRYAYSKNSKEKRNAGEVALGLHLPVSFKFRLNQECHRDTKVIKNCGKMDAKDKLIWCKKFWNSCRFLIIQFFTSFLKTPHTMNLKFLCPNQHLFIPFFCDFFKYPHECMHVQTYISILRKLF